jgi:hypothetical protein
VFEYKTERKVRKRKIDIQMMGKKQIEYDVSQTEEKYGKEFEKRRYGETETAGGAWLLGYPNKVDTTSEA